MKVQWYVFAGVCVFGMVYWTVRRKVYPKPKVIKGMKSLLISQVIKNVQEAKGRSDKVNILQSNMCPALVGILRMNFDDDLELDVDLNLQYRPRKEMDWVETLNSSTKTWRGFTKQSIVPQNKKNLRLKAMLESLEPREAALFMDAANKRLRLGMSKSVLSNCFPNLFKSNS